MFKIQKLKDGFISHTNFPIDKAFKDIDDSKSIYLDKEGVE